MSVSGHQSFSSIQITTVIFCGVVSSCITALQPLLLSDLVEHNRLHITQIGLAAMAESVGMAMAMTYAAFRFTTKKLRTKATVALLSAMVTNCICSVASFEWVILLRLICGLCSGVLLWILVGMMSRSSRPGRMFALYAGTQAVISFLLAILLGQWLLEKYGATAGYLLIATLDLILISVILNLPDSYCQIPNAQKSIPPAHGVVALGSIFFSLVGIVGFWVYVIPIGREVGHSLNTMNEIVSLVIGFQILSGALGVWLSDTLRAYLVCLTGVLFLPLLVILFLYQSHPIVIFSSLSAFCFMWIFIPPFQMQLIVEIDPSLNSAMFIGTAQLFGVASGPLIASQISRSLDLTAIGYTSIGCFVISATLLVISRPMADRKAAHKHY